MLTEPPDLDRAELAHVLAKGWNLRDVELDYVPVGFGSHHWRAVDRQGTQTFVSVDDLQAAFHSADPDSAFADLERAFRTAVLLRDRARLEFVAAPLADRDGAVLHRIGERYAVRVARLVDGESHQFGEYETAAERREMAVVLGRLHAATAQVPADLPRRDDLALPSRAELVEALEDLDRPWVSGPFAERVRKLLLAKAVQLGRRLHEYDELAARVRKSSESWVVTHGEPHRANVIRDRRGGVHLVDWDTTLVAPRERDLMMVLDRELTGWDEYKAVAPAASLNQDALELYRRWWELADVTVFVAEFRRPHERSENTVAAWRVLAANLSGA